MVPNQVASTEDIKTLRVKADALIEEILNIQEAEDLPPEQSSYLYELARVEAFRAANEAKMWLGKMLEGKGNSFPKELADKAD